MKRGVSMRKNKYFNKKVYYEDDKRGALVFDSKKEFQHYLLLKERESKGEIQELELQKTFLLIPSMKKKEYKALDGSIVYQEAERKCSYITDFYYYDLNLKTYVAEDSKGMKLKDYIIKRKLFKFLYREILFLEN